MVSCSKAELTGWKVLQEDSYGNKFSYDEKSVKHTSEDSVTVWARSNAAKYLYEINCKNRKARILQENDTSIPNPQWIDIVGHSGDELVYQTVCP
jgi:hypothetical protein